MAFQCGQVSTKFSHWYSRVPYNIRWVAQWCSSIHYANRWHCSGIPVYTGPVSVHWLRARDMSEECCPDLAALYIRMSFSIFGRLEVSLWIVCVFMCCSPLYSITKYNIPDFWFSQHVCIYVWNVCVCMCVCLYAFYCKSCEGSTSTNVSICDFLQYGSHLTISSADTHQYLNWIGNWFSMLWCGSKYPCVAYHFPILRYISKWIEWCISNLRVRANTKINGQIMTLRKFAVHGYLSGNLNTYCDSIVANMGDCNVYFL